MTVADPYTPIEDTRFPPGYTAYNPLDGHFWAPCYATMPPTENSPRVANTAFVQAAIAALVAALPAAIASYLASLPTSDPGVPGAPWLDRGTLAFSQHGNTMTDTPAPAPLPPDAPVTVANLAQALAELVAKLPIEMPKPGELYNNGGFLAVSQ